MLEVLFTKTTIKALELALAEANGNAKTRTLSVEDCGEYIVEFETRCDIPKSAMSGTQITIHASMEKLPKSYKYPATSTKAVFEFDGRKWRLLKAMRDYIVQRAGNCHVTAVFSQSAKAAIVDNYSIC